MIDIDDKCRACMRRFGKKCIKNDLLQKQSQLALEFTESCGILVGDHPRYLCNECSNKTRKFYQFKQMCMKSRQTFVKWLDLKISGASESYGHEEDSLHSSIEDDEGAMKEGEDYIFEDNDDSQERPEQDEKENEWAADPCNLHSDNSLDAQDVLDPIAVVDSGDRIINEKENKPVILDDENLQAPPSLENSVPANHSFDKTVVSLGTPSSLLTLTVKHKKTQIVSRAKQELNKITKTTQRNERFPCEICQKICVKKDSFERHMRKHQGLDPFYCDRENCNQTFKTLVCLNRHYRKHDGITFQCTEDGCGQKYASSDYLQKHIRQIHLGEIPTPRHVCEVCGKVLANATILHMHRYRHKDKSEWPFGCDQADCTSRFVFNWEYEEHKRYHAGLIRCPYCNVIKSTQTLLNTHINLHTKEKTYPCKVCGKTFYGITQMAAHVWKVHEKHLTYFCRYCPRRYKSDAKRQIHEDKHRNQDPQVAKKVYTCTVCQREYAEARGLRAHMAKMHAELKSTDEKHQYTDKLFTFCSSPETTITIDNRIQDAETE